MEDGISNIKKQGHRAPKDVQVPERPERAVSLNPTEKDRGDGLGEIPGFSQRHALVVVPAAVLVAIFGLEEPPLSLPLGFLRGFTVVSTWLEPPAELRVDRLEHREGEARARAGPGPHPEDGPLGHVGVGEVGGEEDHLGPGFDFTRPGPPLDANVLRHEALENRERVHASNL